MVMESVLMGKLVRGVEFLPDIHEVWSKNYELWDVLFTCLDAVPQWHTLDKSSLKKGFFSLTVSGYSPS